VDFLPSVATSGGSFKRLDLVDFNQLRFPDVNAAVNAALFKSSFSRSIGRLVLLVYSYLYTLVFIKNDRPDS
jgi:hypothetical protein